MSQAQRINHTRMRGECLELIACARQGQVIDTKQYDAGQDKDMPEHRRYSERVGTCAGSAVRTLPRGGKGELHPKNLLKQGWFHSVLLARTPRSLRCESRNHNERFSRHVLRVTDVLNTRPFILLFLSD